MPSAQPNRSTGTVIGNILSAIVGITLGAGVALYVSGDQRVTGTLTSQNLTATGALQGATLTGGKLNVNKVSQGTGALSIHGSSGGLLCIFDTDSGGWSVVTATNGTVNGRVALSGECP